MKTFYRLPFLLALTLAACVPEREPPAAPEPPVVRTRVVSPEPFRGTLRLLGVVRPAATIPIQTLESGQVSYPERFAEGLRTGERVEAGERLASIRNDPVSSAVRRARLEADAALVELRRMRDSVTAQLVPAAELARAEVAERLSREQLALAERSEGRLRLVAPRGGRLVVTRILPPQSEVTAGLLLGEIAADGAARVEALAAASSRESLRPGQPVRFLGRDVAEPAGTGVVAEVASVVDAAGTIRVVATVSANLALPPHGEGVVCEVQLDARPDALVVTEEAVLPGSGGEAVFVVDTARATGGLARVRRVQVATGIRSAGRVEIVLGLAAGERVVVSGQGFLEDGMTVKEVPEAEPSPAPSPAAASPSPGKGP